MHSKTCLQSQWEGSQPRASPGETSERSPCHRHLDSELLASMQWDNGILSEIIVWQPEQTNSVENFQSSLEDIHLRRTGQKVYFCKSLRKTCILGDNYEDNSGAQETSLTWHRGHVEGGGKQVIVWSGVWGSQGEDTQLPCKDTKGIKPHHAS